MKLCKQVSKLVEDGLSGLSDSDLKKFLKDFQENILLNKAQGEGFFTDGVTFEFESISYSGDYEKHYSDPELDSDFQKNPKNFVQDISLVCYSPKELVAIILNDYTLDRESTEDEDQQAFEYLLKHLKGQDAYIDEKGVELSGQNEQGKSFSTDIDVTAKIKIKNFKYDASKDELHVTDYDIIELDYQQ